MSGPSRSREPLLLLRASCLIALLFGLPCLGFCYNIFNDRKLAKEVRRSARLEEMKALMAPLDRFYAKSKSGEVMDREEMGGGEEDGEVVPAVVAFFGG